MQLKDHLAIIRRSILFVFVFGLVAAAVTMIVASKRAPTYYVVQDYEIRLVNRSATPDYQYGSYYDLKGAELFTQHVMSLLRSPAVIGQIYTEAGLGYTVDNVSEFTNQFRTDQGSSQEMTVTFSRYTEAEAKALAEAMSVVLTDVVTQSQTDSTGNSLFVLHHFEPVIVYQETNVWLVTITALIAGWILGLILVYIRRYLQA